MLPKQPEIFLAKRCPPAVVAHEPRIKGIDLGGGYDLGGSMSGKRPQHMNEIGALQDRKVVHDRLPAGLTGPSESCRFKEASALREQHFGKPFEGMPPL